MADSFMRECDLKESDFVFHSIISLKRKIEHLLNPCEISVVPCSREILEFAYRRVLSLQKNAERKIWSRRGLSRTIRHLEIQIREKITKVIRSNSPTDQQEIKRDIQCLSKWEMDMENSEGKFYVFPEEEEEEEDDATVSSSTIGSGGCNSKMVGLCDQYIDLKQKLISDWPTTFRVISLVGMAGIGKTALAEKIYEDPDTMKHFEYCAWVTIGRKCRLEDIPGHILAQLNQDSDQMLVDRDEDLAPYLGEILKNKRYLLVLDDVWNKYMACHCQFAYLRKYVNPFPREKSGSRVLLTTRIQQVDNDNYQFPYGVLTMRLLNKEESWDLLQKEVFVEEFCPSQLENDGKKIAEHCDGLPLTIIAVADRLSKAEKTLKYWSEVAAQKSHKVFKAVYNEIAKILLPSYKFLPRILQICFLYMGVFPQNYEIARSKLIRMWIVDEFPELNAKDFDFPAGMECLAELVCHSLIMTYPITTDSEQVKTCRLHSSFWHLANREARKIKFSYVLNSRDDGLEEGIKNQRRLSFHNNILFGIKDVHKSVVDNCASTAHSLLCYGPYHQYQVPVCFGLGLVKQLDALTIRFYEFPIEVLQLVQLRYLALTLDEKLPASISYLSKLEFLIVHRHLRIRSYRDPLYLLVEIWNMKLLQHLEVMGFDLPDPCGDSLECLFTLANVSAHSCIEGIHEAIPNLRKLGLLIELGPNDDGKPLNCFDHISNLKHLESLKCDIISPEVVQPIAPFSILPKYLKKLCLSGLGYPWNEMSKIMT